MKCSLCEAVISAGDWLSHQSRFHAQTRMGDRPCSLCSFRTPTLVNALTHSLLSGHGLSSTQSNYFIPLILWPDEAGQEDYNYQADVDRNRNNTMVAESSFPVTCFPISNEEQIPVKDDDDFDGNAMSAPEQKETKAARSSMKSSARLECSSPVIKTFLKCVKCGSQIKGSQSSGGSDRTSNAVSHAKTCLRIRPYACTSCGYRSTQKHATEKHIRRRCPDGRAELGDKAEDEKAMRLGLQQCYPGLNIPWRGFAN